MLHRNHSPDRSQSQPRTYSFTQTAVNRDLSGDKDDQTGEMIARGESGRSASSDQAAGERVLGHDGGDRWGRGGRSVVGGAAINEAASQGHLEVVRTLLQSGASWDTSEPESVRCVISIG